MLGRQKHVIPDVEYDSKRMKAVIMNEINFLSNNIDYVAEAIKNNPQKAYDFVTNHFAFLPSCFSACNSDEAPIRAVQSICFDVDGAKGFNTNYTPKELISIYKQCWSKTLDIDYIDLGRKTKYEYYEAKWENTEWGAVSGDVLFSFPKNAYSEIKKLNISNEYIKLFARLCYTIGNFIPSPKKGRGKLSTNILHSYHRSYINGIGWERFDKYLYDSCFNNKSKYYNDYKKFGSYFGEEFKKNNYFEDCLMKNDKVIDLVTLETVDNGLFHEFVSTKDIKNYIINVCACIIIRGNKMIEEMKINNVNNL